MVADYLIFNSRDQILRVKIQNVVYFESDGNYTSMVTAWNNAHSLKSMNVFL